MAETNQHLSAAHSHRIGGEYDEASRLYRVVLEANDSLAEAWWGLGLTLMNMGEFEDSVAALEKATQLDTTSQKYLLDLAKHQTMLGMFDEAKPVFERVIELNAGTREAEEARNQLRYY